MAYDEITCLEFAGGSDLAQSQEEQTGADAKCVHCGTSKNSKSTVQ